MSQVVLVAIEVNEDNMRHAQELLMMILPPPGTGAIDSWWIAEDERYDNSDNDSAVFCDKGGQAKARKMLGHNGLAK